MNDTHVLLDDVRLGQRQYHDVHIAGEPRHGVGAHHTVIAPGHQVAGVPGVPTTHLQNTMFSGESPRKLRGLSKLLDVFIPEGAKDIRQLLQILFGLHKNVLRPRHGMIVEQAEIVLRGPAACLQDTLSKRSLRSLNSPAEDSFPGVLRDRYLL